MFAKFRFASVLNSFWFLTMKNRKSKYIHKMVVFHVTILEISRRRALNWFWIELQFMPSKWIGIELNKNSLNRTCLVKGNYFDVWLHVFLCNLCIKWSVWGEFTAWNTLNYLSSTIHVFYGYVISKSRNYYVTLIKVSNIFYLGITFKASVLNMRGWLGSFIKNYIAGLKKVCDSKSPKNPYFEFS